MPELERYRHFTSAVLMGKGNYLCTTRLATALRDKHELFATPEHEELLRVAAWAETTRDEGRVRAVWGDIFHRLYVLIDAKDDADFRQKSDAWLAMVEQQKAAGMLSRGFSPSMLSPGPSLSAKNGAAWSAFWTSARVQGLTENLREGGERIGFSKDAFAPFLARLAAAGVAAPQISDGEKALYGVAPGRDGKGIVWLASVVPGPRY